MYFFQITFPKQNNSKVRGVKKFLCGFGNTHPYKRKTIITEEKVS